MTTPATSSLVPMVRLAFAFLVVVFALGGLPRSSSVKDQAARSQLLAVAGQVETPTSTTSTTLTAGVEETREIRQLVSERIVEVGYPAVTVDVVDGVVTIGGTVPDEASRRVVMTQARSVMGAAEVVDRLDVASARLTGDVVVEAHATRVQVAGAVPDADIVDAVLDALGAVYPAERIESTLTVDPTVTIPVRLSAGIEASRTPVVERFVVALDGIDETLAIVDVAVTRTDPAPIERDLDALLAMSPILFRSGSTALDTRSGEVLDEIAQILERFPDAALDVGGHADDVGDEQSNERLGLARAEAVVNGLRDRGVTSALAAVGFGSLRPDVEPADDPAARAANRRIEFVLLDP